MDTQEAAMDAIAGSGPFATFLRTAKESNFEFDLNTLFEFGLTRMLDGLAVYLGNPTRSDPRPAMSQE
jgi:hypothetical protein